MRYTKKHRINLLIDKIEQRVIDFDGCTTFDLDKDIEKKVYSLYVKHREETLNLINKLRKLI